MMKCKGIQALLFDWVGVLVSINGDKNLSEKSKRIDEEIRKNWNGSLSQETLCKQLCIDENEFPKAMDTFVIERFQKFKPLWEALPDFKKKYKMAVINNGPAITVPSFQRVFQFDFYGIFLNSGIEGVRKPDPEIYYRALNRLNVDASNALYMDDSPGTPEIFNLTGIQSFTWNNQVDGFEELKRRIEKKQEKHKSAPKKEERYLPTDKQHSNAGSGLKAALHPNTRLD